MTILAQISSQYSVNTFIHLLTQKPFIGSPSCAGHCACLGENVESNTQPLLGRKSLVQGQPAEAWCLQSLFFALGQAVPSHQKAMLPWAHEADRSGNTRWLSHSLHTSRSLRMVIDHSLTLWSPLACNTSPGQNLLNWSVESELLFRATADKLCIPRRHREGQRVL